MPAHRLTSDEARKLSKLGARKGGRARANVLTPQERRESARKAAEARWDRVRAAKAAIASKSEVVLVDPKLDKPIALFSGKLRIAARSLACHVLNDWKRVIPQDDVVRSLAGHFEGSLDRFLETGDLKPFVHNLKVADRRVDFLIRPQSAGERKQRSTRHGISDDLSLNWWTSNRTTQAVIRQSLISATGYEATLLLDICEAYLKLREQAASASSHWSLARQAELITRACAKVGILGLIDGSGRSCVTDFLLIY